MVSTERVVEAIELVKRQIEVTFFATGAKDIDMLQNGTQIYADYTQNGYKISFFAGIIFLPRRTPSTTKEDKKGFSLCFLVSFVVKDCIHCWYRWVYADLYFLLF